MRDMFVLLSDLHFKGTSEDSETFNKLDAVINCIKANYSETTNRIIFLINGDIANNGKDFEYKAANAFFKNICSKVKNITGIDFVSFIFSPGNHDCNFDSYSIEERRSLSQNIDSKKILQEYENYERKIGNYRKFVSNLFTLGSKKDYRFFTEYKMETINIISFNSTLVYDYEFKNNRMIVSSKYVDDNLSIDSSKLYIALSHFPIEWYDRTDSENYCSIYKGMNILITSHEHKADAIHIERKKENYFEIRLPAFNPTNQQAKSGFMILGITDNEIELFEYCFNGSLFTETNRKRVKVNSLERIDENLLCDYSELKKIFDTCFMLNGLDNNNQLDDFFVKPTLVKVSIKHEISKIYDFIEFDDFDQEKYEALIILSGKQFIGKTTILYNLINKYLKQKYIPVYIDASKFPSDIPSIKKAITKFISRVYSRSVDYINQSTDRIILMIDNAHSMKSKFKSILDELLNIYKKVIVTTSSQFFEDNSFDDFTCGYDFFDIMPFGNNQKFQLIENWAKNSSHDNEYIINQKINEVMSIINKIDSERNFMNTPTLLIVFLHAYEDKKTDNLMNGSKGVYYQYLIDKQIIRLSEKTEIESTFIERYLSELAYMQFFQNDDFNEGEFDKLFLKSYPISQTDYYSNISKLKKVFNVDEVFQGGLAKGIYFTNDLVFSYYVAKYLQKKNHLLKDSIQNMLSNIDNPINSNILLFYLYFTQDNEVINQVILKANSLFSDHDEVQLEDDINFINDMIIGYKDISAVENVREKNQDLNKKIDKIEYYRRIRNKGENENENNPIIIERTCALRIADIVTEVLNLFPETDVYNKLVESIIKLSLRKTSDLIMLIFSYLVFLSDQPKEFIETKKEQIDRQLNRLLFTMIRIFMELAENVKNKKTKDFTKAIIDGFEKKTSLEMLKMILEIYFQRGEEKVDYDFVVKLKEKMMKNDNKFAAGMIHIVIEFEINYVGMNTRAKNDLLKKLNIEKIQRFSKSPLKQIDNIKQNRKERLKILLQKKK